ncbi:MAG: epoxyqueuosine reductase, partial [Candidatus Hodarchaeota archaeon]
MASERISRLKDEILRWGASLASFGDMEGLLPKRWSSLNTGISIAIRLSEAIINEIKSKPTPLYADHYHIMNRSLDQIALRTASLLQSWGYKALPIPSSPFVYVGNLGGYLSHKMVATRAGLGWIGKNNLLITPQYGPRIRLVSILTDAPLHTSSPCNESNCGKCQACIVACPNHAL